VSIKALVAGSVVVLVIAGLAYWAFDGSKQSVAPQSSTPPPPMAAPSTPQPTPPPSAPPSASQPTPPASTPPSPPVASTAPPVSTAVAPSAPQPTLPTTPPVPTAVAPPPPPPATALPAEAGMSEANRRQVQEALHRLDYYRGPVDGIFGPLTRAAISRFQHEIGADVTGHLSAGEANRLVTR
jgi:hypothetical protein